MPEAKVTAIVDLNHPRIVKADSNGVFFLNDMPAGKVPILASKSSEGYADSIFSFYDAPGTDTSERWIEVVAGHETRDVVIKVGPRCATLHFHILDDTGRSIPFGVLFDRPDIPGPYRTSVPAEGNVQVPPVRFRMTIESAGYKNFEYSLNGDPWIVLKSGDTLDVSAQLRKK